jgi:hypothetical protein
MHPVPNCAEQVSALSKSRDLLPVISIRTAEENMVIARFDKLKSTIDLCIGFQSEKRPHYAGVDRTPLPAWVENVCIFLDFWHHSSLPGFYAINCYLLKSMQQGCLIWFRGGDISLVGPKNEYSEAFSWHAGTFRIVSWWLVLPHPVTELEDNMYGRSDSPKS